MLLNDERAGNSAATSLHEKKNILQIEVELSTDLAWAFAQFLKRVSLHDYRALAVSEQEAGEVQDASEKLREALA